MGKTKKWSARDSRECIMVPSALDHKYSRGVLGVITGSAQYPGAAVLSTSAALATGVGMVRFNSSSGLAHLVLHGAPEVVVQPGKVSAWLLGSGIDHRRYRHYSTWLRHRWFELAKRQSYPTVLDAGALYLSGKLSQPTVITPHYGELARLLTERGTVVSAEAIEGNFRKWAVTASQILGVTVLLKGSITVIAHDEELIEMPTATPWLATAGTGDVLAGILGALVTTNTIEILNKPERMAEVAATACHIHNAAALRASDGGPISATSLLTEISGVVADLV
jgi:hydroxyethylthiazole kinase-like uncharacterized protein yjeF